MFGRIKDTISDYLYDHDGILAVLVVIGIIVLVTALCFGGYCLTGWILMLIYNLIRGSFGWPEFSYWVFVGIAFVISLLKPTVSVKNKGD